MNRALPAVAIVAALAVPATAQPRSTKMEYLACKSEGLFARAEEIRRSQDSAALKTFLTGSLLSGACVWLPSGTQVYYEGSGSSVSMVKIRPQGEITSFFTRIEVLD